MEGLDGCGVAAKTWARCGGRATCRAIVHGRVLGRQFDREIGDVNGSVGGVNGDMFLGQLTTEADHEHPAKGWWAGGGKQCARTESRPGTGP